MSQVEFHIGKAKVCLVQGDITNMDTEAIVNAANSSLMGGGEEASTAQSIGKAAQRYLKNASF